MALRYCNLIDCTAGRKYSDNFSETFKYVLSELPFDYECKLANDVSNHNYCILCQLKIDVHTLCYVFQLGRIGKDQLIYKFGIPADQFCEFRRIGTMMLENIETSVTKKGSTFCPFHTDKRKSAIVREDGSLYCFAEGKSFSKADVSKKIKL